MKTVFLSFSPVDSSRVKALLPQLGGKDIEFDFYEVPPGLEAGSPQALAVKEAIGEKIIRSSATVCLIGNDTHLDSWVDIELQKSRNKPNRIIAMAFKGVTVALLPQVIKEENITFYPWNPGKLERLILKEDPRSPLDSYR